MTHVRLGPGAEFDIVRRMAARWGPLAHALGDDGALLDVPRGDRLVVSTDTAVEGVHFRRDWLTLQESAYRGVTAALSDLAAMAAAPLGVMVSLQLPERDVPLIDELADGIGEAVRAAGTTIRGGNVARGDALAITTTVLGAVFSPLRRSDARPGDLLYVTGSLGGPSAAVRALEAHRAPSTEHRARLARPAARLAESRWLAARGAVAAIDISDGIASDSQHLAAASGVGVHLQVERLPVLRDATVEDALAGGEEYELVVVGRAPLPSREFESRFKIPLTPVGRVDAGSGEVVLTRDGERVAAPSGYDHFSR